jgi:hypothetical protein
LLHAEICWSAATVSCVFFPTELTSVTSHVGKTFTVWSLQFVSKLVSKLAYFTYPVRLCKRDFEVDKPASLHVFDIFLIGDLLKINESHEDTVIMDHSCVSSVCRRCSDSSHCQRGNLLDVCLLGVVLFDELLEPFNNCRLNSDWDKDLTNLNLKALRVHVISSLGSSNAFYEDGQILSKYPLEVLGFVSLMSCTIICFWFWHNLCYHSGHFKNSFTPS